MVLKNLTLQFSGVTKENYKNMVFGVSANVQDKHFPKTSEKFTTWVNLFGEEGVKDEILIISQYLTN